MPPMLRPRDARAPQNLRVAQQWCRFLAERAPGARQTQQGHHEGRTGYGSDDRSG
jgi:hypothetical protein